MLHHIDVWYDVQYKSWVVTQFNKAGYQVDGTECSYHALKKEAIAEAKAITKGTFDIDVFNAYGEYQKTIK